MRINTARILLGLAFVLFSGLAIPIVSAQSNTGTIVGTATDDTGAAIPNATVTTKNLGTGEERAVTTDGNGQFTVSNLQIGHYSLNVTHAGFAPAQIADTELQVAQRATINPVLHVGAANDKVTVIA
ncbi:MAG TPA: carboxypeptidase-like regulatory domain-containing protein, partial [Edaphobacter sp.]|nr:carboxypeptidase-like regulatory domain-containing protein [Edaphobacter sp.]